MGNKVSIPGVLVKEKLSGYAFYQDLMRQLEEGVKNYIATSTNNALDQEVDHLLGRGVYVRRDEQDQERVTAYCLGCHSRRRQEWARNGHKRRGLATLWGSDLLIWMPRVECQVCGGTVHVEYETVASRQRLWHDVRAETREASGVGQSLREIKERLDSDLATSFGLRTLNEQVHRMAELVGQWQEQTFAVSPPVLLLDALWVRVMKREKRSKRDKKKRRRVVKRARWIPVMVALGLWPEEKKKVILDWEVGEGPGEDAASWLRLLTRVEERGIRGARGLRLIIHDGSKGLQEALEEVHFAALRQRCLFHKLRNILQVITLPDDLKREEARRIRRLILREASAIWQAPEKESARQRQEEFCLRWASSQPQVVETMRRDFEDTLTYYDVLAWAKEQGELWPVTWLRTTSPLERVNRSYRRKLRQMVIAHSEIGLRAILYQATIRIEHGQAGDPHGWTSFIEQLLWDSS